MVVIVWVFVNFQKFMLQLQARRDAENLQRQAARDEQQTKAINDITERFAKIEERESQNRMANAAALSLNTMATNRMTEAFDKVGGCRYPAAHPH